MPRRKSGYGRSSKRGHRTIFIWKFWSSAQIWTEHSNFHFAYLQKHTTKPEAPPVVHGRISLILHSIQRTLSTIADMERYGFFLPTNITFKFRFICSDNPHWHRLGRVNVDHFNSWKCFVFLRWPFYRHAYERLLLRNQRSIQSSDW